MFLGGKKKKKKTKQIRVSTSLQAIIFPPSTASRCPQSILKINRNKQFLCIQKKNITIKQIFNANSIKITLSLEKDCSLCSNTSVHNIHLTWWKNNARNIQCISPKHPDPTSKFFLFNTISYISYSHSFAMWKITANAGEFGIRMWFGLQLWGQGSVCVGMVFLHRKTMTSR